jgi:hypothetical protein
MAFPDSVLVDEAEDKAGPAVFSDKKPDNAEAGFGLEAVIPASQSEKNIRNMIRIVRTLIFGADSRDRKDGKEGGWEVLSKWLIT